MYIITNTKNSIVKTADTIEQANKIAKQLQIMFDGIQWNVKEIRDVWEANYSL